MRPFVCTAISLLLVLGPVRRTRAVEAIWTNASLGDWFIGGNWSTGAPPAFFIDAFIEKGGIAFINAPGARVSELNVGVLKTFNGNGAGSLLIGSGGRLGLQNNLIVGGSDIGGGQTGNGTVVVSAGGRVDPMGGFSSNNLVIADYGPGSVTITDASSYIDLNNGQVQVGSGQQGAGVLKIQNGGELRSSFGAIGSNTNSSGSVTVTGTNSRWLMTDGLEVGRFGAGTLTISNGGSVQLANRDEPNFESAVAGAAGATGSVTVTGAGSTWYAEQIFVGGGRANNTTFGIGAIHILNGGQVRASVLKQYSTGSVEVNNGSTTVAGLRVDNLQNRVSIVEKSGNLGDLVVGNTVAGRMEVTAGGFVMNHRGYIGLNTSIEGAVLVSGSNSYWQNNGSVWVGNSGSGTLEVSDGGSVLSGGNGYLAFSTNTSGYAAVRGEGSRWDTAVNLYIGGNVAGPGGSGTLRIENGGSVNALATKLYNTGYLELGANPMLNSALTVLGGAIQAVNDTTFINNVTLGAEGASVYSAGHTLTLSGVISGAGGLTKGGSFTGLGPGTVILSGENTYTGATAITFGRLVVIGKITSPVSVNSGTTLGGSGTVGHVTVNNGGMVASGNSAGRLTIDGNYTQSSGGTLAIEVGGRAAGTEYDQLVVNEVATIGGTLNIKGINGFLPQVGETFQILTSNGLSGNFAAINATGFTVRSDASATGIVLTVTATEAPGTLGNISTRLRVDTGDNVLIGGFIITGTQPKRVIVRAIGPSLPLVGKLVNPTLELHGPGGLIASNDNWRSNQEADIIASTVPPGNDLEAAIVATLPANSTGYTAIARGAGSGTGIGLVEVYDLDRTADSKLANISSRGLVQTGDNVMIGGFIITGSNPQKVIVRAIGPSLPVPGKLADPTLELFNRDGVMIASNDNWRSNQQAEIIASTVPPTNDLESAIVATFPPTPHTAIVRGKGGATGVALVEVFSLN